MKISSHATHYIKSKDDLNFSEIEYSKFKFGDSNIGNKYGRDLFISFEKKYREKIKDYEIINVFSSPYFYIPTATLTITEAFIDLLSNKYPEKIIEQKKINRTTTYSVDYGNLSASERLKLISNDIFKIDEKIKENELLIFIDDIKITGSHEFVVKKMLNSYSISNECIFLYHAILKNKNIDPKFENFLNYGFVKKLSDVNKIIDSKNFKFNTRVIKYILNSKRKDFLEFIKDKDKSFLTEMLNNAKGNKYYDIPEYSENFFKLVSLEQQL